MNFPPGMNKTAPDTVPRKRALSEFTISTVISNKENSARELVAESPKLSTKTNYQVIEEAKNENFDTSLYYGQNEYEDIGYRKRLDDQNSPNSRSELFDDSDQLLCSTNEGERLQYGYYDSKNEERGWSRVALDAVNDVAYKAWEFCKNSAAVFKGFYAGGGEKYPIICSHDSSLYDETAEKPVPRETSMFNYSKFTQGLTRHYLPDYHNSIPLESDYLNSEHTSPRPAKRYQLSSNNNDSLEKNWVVIQSTTSKPPSTRKQSFMATSSKMRPSCSRKIYNSKATRASIGSPTKIPWSNPRSHIPRVSYAGSSIPSSNKSASFANIQPSRAYIPCPLSPQGNISRKNTSLISESPATLKTRQQAERWASLIKQDEKRQQESIKRLDTKLKTMIREGREALRSKIEVCMEEDDEAHNKFIQSSISLKN